MSSGITSIQSQFNLNSANPNNERIYEFENFRLNGANLMLYRDGEPVALAPKVIETLLALVERPGEVVSKNEMMKRLWADSFVEDANLAQNIYLLRKTLGKAENGEHLIETFRRRGYRFNGKIKPATEKIEPDSAAAQEEQIIAGKAGERTAGEKPPPASIFSPVRYGKLLMIAGLIGGLVILGWFGLSLLNGRGQNSADNAPEAQNIVFKRLAPQLNTFFPTLSPDGRRLAYSLIESGGNSLWLKDMASGEAAQLLPKIKKSYRALKFSPDGTLLYFLTHENILARIKITGGEPEKLLSNVANPFAISPDGAKVVFVRGRSLIIADTNGSGERVLVERNGESQWFSTSFSQPAWSPDGAAIAISGGYIELGKKYAELVEINVDSGQERRVSTPDWGQISDVAWLSDKSGLLVTARENINLPAQIWYLSYPDGMVRRITNDLNSYEWLSLTADSRSLATSKAIGGSNIWIASLNDLNNFRQITFNDSTIIGRAGIAFMPDGRILYASPSSGNIDLWMMSENGENQKPLTLNAGDWNGRQRVSPDGRFIVFVSTRSGSRAIWRMNSDGGGAVRLTEGKGEDYPSFSPDGKWIYYTDDSQTTPAIWRIALSGSEPERISGDFQAVIPSVSPDGKLIAFLYAEKGGQKDWKVALMKTEDKLLFKLFDIDAYRGILYWTADSKSLLYIAEKSPNLWQQPLDGSAPKQLTFFSLEETWNFAVSPDSQKIAVARGNAATEAVLINNFR